jgi:hypothetical protein
MNAARTLSTPNRTRQILEDLEAVRENLLALRKALQVEDGLYAESNLSANGIRDMIRQLLAVFQIPNEEMKFYLREDRDAGRGEQRGRVNQFGAS